MSNCNHDHSHQKADKWTNIATLGEATASFISDAYWLGSIFDVASGFTPEYMGLSTHALGFGATLALLSAGGAAYSHRVLNKHHQPDSADGEDKTIDQCEKGQHSLITSSINAQPQQQLVTSTHTQTKHSHLAWWQLLALCGDFISHTGDIAGPLTFVITLATSNSLARWKKGLAQCGTTLFGAVSTAANVRTCKDAMTKSAHRHSHAHVKTPLLQ